MPSKKPKKLVKSETPEGDQILVRRVDAMMSVDQPEMPPAPDTKPSTAKTTTKPKAKPKPKKPAATKTAPKLSSKLLEGLETSYDNETPEPAPEPAEAPAGPPLVIKLADEGQESPEPEAEIEDPADTDKDPLEDNDTDKAVDDIVAHEGDTVLAVNDALVAREQGEAVPAGPRIKHKWAWFIFLIIVVGSAADAYIFLTK